MPESETQVKSKQEKAALQEVYTLAHQVQALLEQGKYVEAAVMYAKMEARLSVMRKEKSPDTTQGFGHSG